MTRELTELQAKLLPMLAWYHRFCVENKLRYYLLGGTMLGAARHKGFIPWDDDIDVGMPRSDYERFLLLTSKHTYGPFIVEDIDTEAKDFFYGYAKIYDTTTTLVENTRYRIKRGLFIDLFPLDGVADKKEDIASVYRPILSKYRLLLARTCAIRKSRKWYKNLAVCIARAVPNGMLDNKRLMLSIDKMCRENDYDKCEYVGNLYGNWGEREIVKRSIMGEPTFYKFEGLDVYGVSDYDAYLTSLYGDWRQLPPKEKQVTHHDFLMLDLRKGYLME